MMVQEKIIEYCDADGNRGITVYEAELEPSDVEVICEKVEAICEKIVEAYEPGKKYYSITLQDDDGRDFEF